MLTRKRFGYLFAMLLIAAFTILYRNIAEGKILHNSQPVVYSTLPFIYL
jgi:hypothetical protein